MNINTCRFLIDAKDEPFVRKLYARWDNFFQHSFEKVFDEVISPFDKEDGVWQIERLELDLGSLPQESFDAAFAAALRAKLKELALNMSRGGRRMENKSLSCQIVYTSVATSAFEALCYFLLHGSLPDGLDYRFSDLNFLLKQTLEQEAGKLHDFLESYGHYAFVTNRLAQQLDDENLEQLLTRVRPSESKFVCLYVRLHLINYKEQFRAGRKQPFIERGVYRVVLWQLVLAYLYSEGKGRFTRKQLLLYTLRGMAAHYNISFHDFVGWMTGALQELQALQLYRTEFLSLLLEIENETLDNRFGVDLGWSDKLFIQRFNCLFEGPDAYSSSEVNLWRESFLSPENLALLFSDETFLRKNLPTMTDNVIHQVVGILFPSEKEFVISYADSLERSRDKGVLEGKSGDGFRLVKWEFIFFVLLEYPQTQLARQAFVCAVLVRLAHHYNVAVADLIALLLPVVEAQTKTVFTSSLTEILMGLSLVFSPQEKKTEKVEKPQQLKTETEYVALLQDEASVEKYLSRYTNEALEKQLAEIRPYESTFIISYSRTLDLYRDGLMEGRAGEGFRIIKWQVLLTCLFIPQGTIFHRKTYVLRVIHALASHYNFSIFELLSSFMNLLPAKAGAEMEELASVVRELYVEHVVAQPTSVKMTDAELERWLVMLFCEVVAPADYQKRWLEYALQQRPALFTRLWRSGDLPTVAVLRLLKSDAKLQSLFVKAFADSRLDRLQSQLQDFLRELGGVGISTSRLEKVSADALFCFVQLTGRRSLSWSLDELRTFLMRSLDFSEIREDLLTILKREMAKEESPTVESTLRKLRQVLEKLNKFHPKKKDIEKELQKQEHPEEKTKKSWTVENAGLVLIAPFFPRLFQYAGYMNENADAFLDDEFRIRAIFLMQYIVYGEEREHDEAQLFLNRLLVLLEEEVPLPKTCEMTDKERSIADSLLGGVKAQWSQLKNTSEDSFRVSFLQRSGFLRLENETAWQLTVDKRAYDLLLDTIPWSFRMLKFRWMEKMINVRWG
jgi:hypothetical protein